MLKANVDAVPHTSRPVNNLYQFDNLGNGSFCGRSGSETEIMPKPELAQVGQSDDHFPFVDSCLPYVKAFSYVWFHLQAAKRQYFKKCERKMPLEEELKLKTKLQNEPHEIKQRWATRLLAKLRKDIESADREKLAHCLAESSCLANAGSQTENRVLPCVISIADLKGKMRRIDCLRQADKVWRLDIVLAVLFRAVPLESTDGERVEKSLTCRQPQLCVNPFHLNVGVRELEIPVSFLNAPKANQAQFVAVTDGVYSRCVFGARELLELSKIPINCDGCYANIGSTIKQPVSGKPQSAFKPLISGNVAGGHVGNDVDHGRSRPADYNKSDCASDEEVASLSLAGPSPSHSNVWRGNDVGSNSNRSGQPQQQRINCYPPSSMFNSSTTATPQANSNNPPPGLSNRVVVVPSHGIPTGSRPVASQHSFQPIRSSPPATTSALQAVVKAEMIIPDEKLPDNASWQQRSTRTVNDRHFDQIPTSRSGPYNSHSNVQQLRGPTGPAAVKIETGSDRLEDFANYVVEAASRSNSPVRKQARLSLDHMASASGDFELSNAGPPSSSANNSTYQTQQSLAGEISSPSLMMHASMGLLPMINGMQQSMAAAAATGSSSMTSSTTTGAPAPAPAAPLPPPTHPLLYSPNPFSLFSSPAITPRTTPRSTPVPNAQSTIAAAVAAAAAQFGVDSAENAASSDRERQLQLAAGLFEQNLRVFGLLGTVSGQGSGSGSSLFRSPGFSGLGGLASGIGSALVSGADTGNAGQTTPANQRSPVREMADASTATAQDDVTAAQQKAASSEATSAITTLNVNKGENGCDSKNDPSKPAADDDSKNDNEKDNNIDKTSNNLEEELEPTTVEEKKDKNNTAVQDNII